MNVSPVCEDIPLWMKWEIRNWYMYYARMDWYIAGRDGKN